MEDYLHKMPENEELIRIREVVSEYLQTIHNPYTDGKKYGPLHPNVSALDVVSILLHELQK